MGKLTYSRSYYTYHPIIRIFKLKFSIIVAAYNVENYIEKCLLSLISLPSDIFELIIVNDGSTDQTKNIIINFLLKYHIKHAKLIDKENGGLSSARNVGLEQVKGEYVIFIDGDDYIQPGELLKICSSITDDCDVIICAPRVEYLALDILKASDSKYFSLPFTGLKAVSELDLCSISPVAWSKIYKTKVIKEKNIKFPDGLLYEDNYWYWMFIKEADKVFFSDSTFYVYVRRTGSIMDHTYSKKEGYSIQRIFLLQKILEDCKKITKSERKKIIEVYLDVAEQDCPQVEKDKLFYYMHELLKKIPSEELNDHLLDIKKRTFEFVPNPSPYTDKVEREILQIPQKTPPTLSKILTFKNNSAIKCLLKKFFKRKTARGKSSY